MTWKEIEEYPGGVVSDDGHSLEVGHLQVGGRWHLHWHHRGGWRLGRGQDNAAAALLTVDEERWGLTKLPQRINISYGVNFFALFFHGTYQSLDALKKSEYKTQKCLIFSSCNDMILFRHKHKLTP